MYFLTFLKTFQSEIMLPTAKETTVQPSSSFVMSTYNVKQTKAQVFDSSNYSVIKPNTQVVKVVEFVGTYLNYDA